MPNIFKPTLAKIPEGRVPRFPTLPTIAEERQLEQLLEGIPGDKQKHWAAQCAKNGSTGICGGFTASWLEHRVWNEPVRANQFDSHSGLQRMAQIQRLQEDDNILPMFSATRLQPMTKTVLDYPECGGPFEVPTGFAMYISLRFNALTYHAFAMDTRPAEIQFADVGSGIYRADEGWTPREVFDEHVGMLEKAFGEKVEGIEFTLLGRANDGGADSPSDSGADAASSPSADSSSSAPTQ